MRTRTTDRGEGSEGVRREPYEGWFGDGGAPKFRKGLSPGRELRSRG